MTLAAPVWHGTNAEAEILAIAVERNCACPQPCAAHLAIRDQQFIDRLVFERRDRDRLMRREFMLTEPAG